MILSLRTPEIDEEFRSRCAAQLQLCQVGYAETPSITQPSDSGSFLSASR